MRRWLLVILFLTTSTLLAQERQGPPQMTRSIPLTAQPDSEFKFIEGSTRLDIWTDVNGWEHRMFAHSWGSGPNESVHFRYKWNEEDGTYTAHRLSDKEVAAREKEMGAQRAQTVTTQPETPQLDEADIPPQHQHRKGPGSTWTTNPNAPIGGVGIELAPPPDGCPCMGQECNFSLTAWEGTQNTVWPYPKYTKTTLTGSGHRWVNNLQRCQWSSTSGVGYYSVFTYPGSPHFQVNPALPPHQEGPHTWGVMPSHWDMTATGDYKCADCPNTWSEDRITATYDTQGYPHQFVFNGYHSDYGEASGNAEGYGDSVSVTSCEQ